ncbi:MAG: iron-sulfur cluster assembly accessory protein [Deltaproteobacteria bacterium]|nr:iron-sulfur cluster assembly accessory protein [Deltaproteobacteria bacterium]
MSQQTTAALNDPQPPKIELTPKAAEMVKKAAVEEGLDVFALRVGVIGGGCSGLQYLLDFVKEPTAEDFVSEYYGVKVVIDPFSAGHLAGTVIDYAKGPHGSGFKFNNPNINNSCSGCSSSCGC